MHFFSYICSVLIQKETLNQTFCYKGVSMHVLRMKIDCAGDSFCCKTDNTEIQSKVKQLCDVDKQTT
jgi:hypothetical protein